MIIKKINCSEHQEKEKLLLVKLADSGTNLKSSNKLFMRERAHHYNSDHNHNYHQIAYNLENGMSRIVEPLILVSDS
jgi:hypothetical protein